jgi:cytochrome c-type biogenesis protein CcmE
MRRAARLGIVVALVAAGGALAFAGAAPEGYKSVGDVLDDPAAFEGREVELKATVVEGSLQRGAEELSFRVADGERSMLVRWDPAVPIPDHEAGGTIEGKNVVLHGHLHEGAFVAHEMIVGCASKYRAA